MQAFDAGSMQGKAGALVRKTVSGRQRQVLKPGAATFELLLDSCDGFAGFNGGGAGHGTNDAVARNLASAFGAADLHGGFRLQR